MEVLGSSAPPPTKYTNLENARRSVTYHSSVWGDHFLAYVDSDITKSFATEEEEMLKQREEVRRMLADGSLIDRLDLIDAIQRLGAGYHFEKVIDETLLHIYEDSCVTWNNCGLRIIALCFRLLRQHGYPIRCDVFEQFKDVGGKFDRSLVADAKGLLSLYEAVHLGTHGEGILEEALEFCCENFESIMLHTNDSSLAKQIKEALNFPIHKSLILPQAKKYMSMYENEESHNKTLLKFAKMNFHALQKMYQKELCDITMWWKDLDFKNKLPFARDRIVECYFWILAFYHEPQFKLGRKMTTKVIVIGSVIDDIYDVQGTLDELQIFTDAVQRWDASVLEQLPLYMRHCYKALLDIYAEMELELGDTSLLYRVIYAKEEIKKLVRAYFQEAKWLFSNQIPILEEYLKVALVTAGDMLLIGTSLVGMGNVVSKEDFEWVASEPLLIQTTSIFTRLMDDMAGFGFEQKFSSVDCYMKQSGCSKDEAFTEFEKRICNVWKDINQERLQPTPASMPALSRVLNCSRIIYFLYKDYDGYTDSNSKLKDAIQSVLIEPLVI